MRRRSQVKRGALYTCNPLLPDPLDKRVYGRDCLCPPREARAAAKWVRPLRIIDGKGRKTAPRREMEMEYGVHCASFLLCTCTTGMARITPCMER